MPDSPDAFIEPATRFGTPSNTQVFVLLAMAAGAAGGESAAGRTGEHTPEGDGGCAAGAFEGAQLRARQRCRDGALVLLFGREPCICLLYTSPSPRDKRQSRMPSSA